MTSNLIYLCAGIYAEGPTDHRFLGALLPRLLEDLAATECKRAFEVAAPFNIGSISPKVVIEEAIESYSDTCTFFVIHADSAGDRVEAFRRYIKPHLDAARARFPSLLAIPCIPKREIEAWMLADTTAFSTWIKDWYPALPPEPEKVLDPKLELKNILAPRGLDIKNAYERLGTFTSISALRRLPSFCLFETDLKAVLGAFEQGSTTEAPRSVYDSLRE